MDGDLVERAWSTVAERLSFNILHSEKSVHSSEKFDAAVDVLRENNLLKLLYDWFSLVVEEKIRKQIAPTFWQNYNMPIKDDDNGELFCAAIIYLHDNLVPLIEGSISVDEHLKLDIGSQRTYLSTKIVKLYRAVLFNSLPKNFMLAIHNFYKTSFVIFQKSHDEVGCCRICLSDNCQCQEIMEKFCEVNCYLKKLNLIEKLSGSAVTQIVHRETSHFIESTCQSNYDTPYMDTLEKWLDNTIISWLKKIHHNFPNDNIESCHDNMKACYSRLLHLVYETYGKYRIKQLFNMIADFPDSKPAILDLKECLDKCDLKSELIKSLKTDIETRLLHPGVDTTEIITVYIASIRTLRLLDSSGIMLDNVCESVRKYLRSRDDTIRCIVTGLTAEGSSELFDELLKGQPTTSVENDSDSEGDGDMVNWESWNPDPVHANTTSRSRRTSDIITMLVNIYGSHELFVKEYQKLLADRILTQFSYDVEREIRYLELLKLRFGESRLHSCEVMLKDIADSRRINSAVHDLGSSQVNAFDFNALILSAQFWPPFREEKLTLPSYMQEALEKFTAGYENFKGNRTLVWKHHLGLVTIEIELKGDILSFTCSPVHVAIIHNFQEKDTWTVDELSSVLQMSQSVVRRKISFWQIQGLLREESADTFVLVEDRKTLLEQPMVADDDREVETTTLSAQSEREEELQVFWTYIVGMLTNLTSLTLERIHKLLSIMFSMQGSTNLTQDELRQFLQSKVSQQKLVYCNGMYQLP